MISLPEWIRSREASSTELETQLQHAAEDLAAARAAIAEAVAAFDADPSTGKALAKARERAQHAAELHARAERLLAQAREREAVEARERDQQRLAELERQLSNPETAQRRAPALASLVEALQGVAEREAERTTIEADLADLELERRRLRQTLHGVEPPPSAPLGVPHGHAVVDALRDLAREHRGEPIGTQYERLVRAWEAM